MLICIAGQNDIAVNVLLYILNNMNYDRSSIVYIPNRNDCGKNGWQKSLTYFAQREKVRQVCLEDIYSEKDLLFLSLEFDRIVKPEKFVSSKLFNIHFSLLPKYKGMYPSIFPILNGDKETGVTLHKIDQGIDTGDIIERRKIKILHNENSMMLYRKLTDEGTRLVTDNLLKLINNSSENIIMFPQSEYEEISSYNSRTSLDFHNLKIDLNQKAVNIFNTIRAFNFRVYQIPKINGNKIITTSITDIKSTQKPGTVIFSTVSSCMIATIDFNLILYYDREEKLFEACKNGNLPVVSEICSVREHINIKDRNGWTPLMVATYYGHFDIVKWLVMFGADINLVDNNGTNLLMLAKDLCVRTGNVEIFNLFYELGISPFQRDYSGKHLIDYCKEEHIDKLGTLTIC